jgi:hypothetical protein
MKTPDDTKTVDLLGDTCDMAGPVPLKPTKAERAAARALAYRERHGTVPMTVHVTAEVLAAFSAKCTATGKKKSAVIQRLIETQFLRQR